ncbi:MAG: nitroreductase family deazaflavin-dependent oxidoreductase [Chloroflexota bacterium]|jgi:deazaflavin-dependent oxidoreductase (nitroreductase family)
MTTTRKPFLPPRWVIRVAWLAHRALYRVTGGRFGLRKPTTKTYGMLRIHTTGRRSGAKRTAILGYFEDTPNLYTLAMNGWGDPEPAWWLNLQAHPEATIELPEGSRDITARPATGDERTRLWSQIAKLDPNLDGYAARRPRETAVVVFEPRRAAQA